MRRDCESASEGARRAHGEMSSRTKPDMMIWPAKVAVIVDAWPAASSPIAQMSSPELPKAFSSAGPACASPMGAQTDS